MENYTIEPALQSDIPAIANLISVCLGTMNFVPSAQATESFEAIERINEEAVGKVMERMLVAKSATGKVIGACALEDHQQGDYFEIGKDRYDEVVVLVVDENFRRQNIGSSLLSAISKLARQDMVFEAWGDNGKVANAHYALIKTGFSHIKNLPGFYKNRGDCPCCVHREKCNEALCTCDIYLKKIAESL